MEKKRKQIYITVIILLLLLLLGAIIYSQQICHTMKLPGKALLLIMLTVVSVWLSRKRLMRLMDFSFQPAL